MFNNNNHYIIYNKYHYSYNVIFYKKIVKISGEQHE